MVWMLYQMLYFIIVKPRTLPTDFERKAFILYSDLVFDTVTIFLKYTKTKKKKTLNFFEIKQCCTNFIPLLAYFSKQLVLYVRVASKERFVRSLVSFLNLSELFERPISFPGVLP